MKLLKNHWLYLSLLLLICALFQVPLLMHLDPLVHPDSLVYQKLAQDLLKNDWSGYYMRTPGYPVYLVLVELLTGSSEALPAVIGQIALSLLLPLGIYLIFIQLCSSKGAAFLLALLFLVDWHTRASALALLTESLSQIGLMIYTCAAVYQLMNPSVGKSLALSLIALILTFIRPAFLPLVYIHLLLYVMYYYKERDNLKRHIGYMSALLIPFTIGVALWCAQVQKISGKFTISHITGVALLNQVVHNDDYKHYPDQELVKAITDQIDERGLHDDALNVGWYVLTEQAAQGIPHWETADKFKELSVYAIKANPVGYLKKVGRNLHEYWTSMPRYVYETSQTYIIAQSHPAVFFTYPFELIVARPPVWKSLVVTMHLLMIGYFLDPSIDKRRKFILGLIAASIITCTFAHVLVNGADLGRYRMPINLLTLATSLYLIGHYLAKMAKVLLKGRDTERQSLAE